MLPLLGKAIQISEYTVVFSDFMEASPSLLIRDAPDTVFAGYPANPKAGYRISG
jgi:hypothetical protein